MNNLVFAKGVNRQYSSEFAQRGAKKGQTINVRLPNKYYVRDQQVMDVQATTEEYTSLTLNHQWGVDISFSSKDLTLTIDDFSKRFLTPAMARIASKIDYDGLALAKDIYNQVGTPGTTIGSASGGSGLLCYTTPNVFLNAGMVLDDAAVPRDGNRHILLNPAAMAASVSGLSGLYNSKETLGEQYDKGMMGSALGFNFKMDQNINLLTNGARTTACSVAVTSTTGDDHIHLKTSTGTLKKGEIFTVADVYAVNPENGQSTGQLQRFVVTADITLAGTSDEVSVAPDVVLAGTGVANGTVNSLPASGAEVTFLSGTASTAYPMNLAYHQDAFTLATADLEMPKGMDFAARESYDGISMRIIRGYDIVNDMWPCRIDVLGGWATLRRELAVRIAG